MGWEHVLPIIVTAAGLIVTFIAGMAGLIWLKTIAPSDAKARIMDLEMTLAKLAAQVKRIDARERKAEQRRRARDDDQDEPDQAEPDQDEYDLFARPVDPPAGMNAHDAQREQRRAQIRAAFRGRGRVG